MRREQRAQSGSVIDDIIGREWNRATEEGRGATGGEESAQVVDEREKEEDIAVRLDAN